MPNNGVELEVAISNYGDAYALANILLKNNYAVMLSKEDSLTIVTAVWAPESNRNYVAFMNAERLEEHYIAKEDAADA